MTKQELCLRCGSKTKKRKVKIKVVILNDADREFIRESNAIEGEHSEIAFDDACESYRWAYKHKDKIDLKFILKVHKLLAKRLNPRIAGKLRKVQVGVMTKEGFKKAIPYKEIKQEIYQLLNLGLYPVYLGAEQIKRFHIQFERIHPFEDFNGRTGRIIMNIQRLRLGLPILVIHTGEEQQSYYQWFKEEKTDG